MISKLIEVTNGFNWGKFMLQRFDREWAAKSSISELKMGLIHQLGWGPGHLWVCDLQTGEGAMFRPGGLASADLKKHAIWVCPMFEPFLEWLYTQDCRDITKLAGFVELSEAATRKHTALSGYRRPGPQLTDREHEVLQLWLEHLCTKKVAAILGTANQTVSNQLASIEDKLEVRGRLELLRRALSSGLGIASDRFKAQA